MAKYFSPKLKQTHLSWSTEPKVQKTENTKMKDEMEIEIGQEQPKLKAKPCIVMDVTLDSVKDTTGKVLGKKVVFLLKHPDKKEELMISSASYLKRQKITTSGIWFTLDDKGQIVNPSALSQVMNFYDHDNLKQFKGQEVKTIEDASGYLTIKAY
jgi:hypothetical protein